jgi:hypothetical protein
MFIASEIPVQRDLFTLVIAIIGATTGVIGAILGIINSVMSWRRDRAHLTVVPQLYSQDTINPRYVLIDRPYARLLKFPGITTDKLKLAIEVINPSSKSITISHVGFARRFAERRLMMTETGDVTAVLPDGPIFGRRVEPQSSFTVYTNHTPRMIFKKYGRFTFALAETAAGKVFCGSSRILRDVIKKLRKDSR